MQLLRILGIQCSTRGAVQNLHAMRLAAACLTQEVLLHEVNLGGDSSSGRQAQPCRQALCAEISRADGVVIAVSEWNFTLPPELRALLDSAFCDGSVLVGKPFAIISTCSGMMGGARMQQDLCVMLLQAGATVRPASQVRIPAAHTKFSPEGLCCDPATRAAVADQVADFLAWIHLRRVSAMVESCQLERQKNGGLEDRRILGVARDIPRSVQKL